MADSAGGIHRRTMSRRGATNATLAVCTSIMCAVAADVRADEIHIGKTVIDGRILEDDPRALLIETESGVMRLPVAAITRRESGPTREQRYQSQVDAQPLTADRHRAIAQWCRDEGMHDRARTHVQAAVEMDPTDEALLRMSGHVPIGDVWIFAGWPPVDTATQPNAQEAVERIVSAWYPLIRTIRDEHFAGNATQEQRDAGQSKLARTVDALAIPAACRVLGDGSLVARLELVGFLNALPEDAAALNLVVLALLDPDDHVRDAAATALRNRDDVRIVQALSLALSCRSHALLRRGVEALAHFRSTTVAERLLVVLSTGSSIMPAVPPREVLTQLEALFSDPTMVPLDGTVYEFPAAISVPSAVRLVDQLIAGQAPELGQHRSYVQDALITVTGQNFGFDISAWRAWIAQDTPSASTGR